MASNKPPLSCGFLYTDFYQLTMAQLYFKAGLATRPVQFDYFFRKYPDYGSHSAGYCIHAGMQWLLNWMDTARCGEEEIQHLRVQKGRDGKPLFGNDFLHWLRDNGSFDGMSLQAIAEGRVVHPDVPLVVARGPLAAAQLLESSLLNHLNYQTLIATKAARIKHAGAGRPVLEFGMRRASYLAANAGVRAALIGGADFSSNAGISYELGFPPRGTHAHSMVQVFMALGEGELGAFRAYAELYPEDCLLLVDTINTLESGVPNAIVVFEELKRKGHTPYGIRLDSGDLAYLSIKSAKMLNDAGFEDVNIILSNKLDEMVLLQIISQIREDSSKSGVDPDHLINRLMYGVGTRLITSKGQGSLDGVYKLVAVKDGNSWRPAYKISETPSKTLNPGSKKVWRIYDSEGKATADLVGLAHENPEKMDPVILQHPAQSATRRVLKKEAVSKIEPLLEDVLLDGKRVGESSSIPLLRNRVAKDLSHLNSGVKRIVNPHRYHVSLTEELFSLKMDLVNSVR
ncbi:MAG: nicotinate phosphoribosyltransferase [Chitinispirillaceae bacterium]